MSAVDSQIDIEFTPERQRHESPSIIDVDALDADDIVYVGSTRASQRRRVGEDGRAVLVTNEVIHVTDSDDDDDIQIIGHNPARLQSPPVRRARIFSPPPPPQIGGIPPVPQIPHRFLRQRPPPGLIIPNEDPFPFEVDLHAESPAEQPFPAAAAPSHHVPSMGFGGALVAGVRRIMGPRNTHQRVERRNNWGVPGSFVMRWSAFDFAHEGEEVFIDGHDEISHLREEDNALAGRLRNQLDRAFKHHSRDALAEPDYKPEYTHPDRPLPGFTHDFSPSTSPSVTEDDSSAGHRASGSGTRACEATLVCVACRDPLTLGASDVGEGRARRKLWSLRCGHLLDGKCIATLMEPVSPTSDATGSSPRIATKPAEYPPSPSQDTVGVDSDTGSMRARLRPRRGVSRSFSSDRLPISPSPSSGNRGASIKAQTTQRGNRKGKGKMKAPVVDAEHEWNCPVSGCGHIHLSLSLDGRWTMDDKRGAIAVFV